MVLITIDPGKNGGIAYGNQGWAKAEKMPETLKDIYGFLQNIMSFALAENLRLFCYLEKVGTYRPGNSGPKAVTFARHCGVLEGILTALNVPYDQVLPSRWEHWFIGKPNHPKIPKEIQGKARKQILAKRKTNRKNKIKAKAQALYPGLNITLATSDALGMFCWGLNARNRL